MTRPRVVIDLDGDASRARDLAHGGAFVRGLDLPELAECELVVQRAGRELALAARVVMVGAGGCGLEVIGFGAAIRERIAEIAGGITAVATPAPLRIKRAASAPASAPPEPAPLPQPEPEPPHGIETHTATQITAAPEPEPEPDIDEEDRGPKTDTDTALVTGALPPEDHELPELPELDTQPKYVPKRPQSNVELEPLALELEPAASAAPLLPQLPMEMGLQTFELETEQPLLDLDAETETETAESETSESETAEAETADGDDKDDGPVRDAPKALHERVRGLNLAQQIKMAQTGETSERILLERLYGKHVWEALLRNPRITGPEVARISRMGQLPRPLIETIVGNGGWLQIPEVRRALLGNPRLSADQIQRILYLLPKHELKLACVNTAYPHPVRDNARRMVRQMKM